MGAAEASRVHLAALVAQLEASAHSLAPARPLEWIAVKTYRDGRQVTMISRDGFASIAHPDLPSIDPRTLPARVRLGVIREPGTGGHFGPRYVVAVYGARTGRTIAEVTR